MRHLASWSLAFAAPLVLACGAASAPPAAPCPCATTSARPAASPRADHVFLHRAALDVPELADMRVARSRTPRGP